MKTARQLIIIKYWIKVLKSNNPLIINVNEMLENDANNRNSCIHGLYWAHHIKVLLEKIGLGNLWLCQNPNDISYVIIKQRILDVFKQSWYTAINNSNRLSHYCLFKQEFEIEEYLQLNMDTKYKAILTKFRLYTNNLAIETRRYNNTDRQQRYCTQCNMNMLEDPYHLLLVCPKYRQLRIETFTPFFCRWPSIQKFTTLMSTDPIRFIYK
jgi:hypothetical protein